jgi:hypothetical protein
VTQKKQTPHKDMQGLSIARGAQLMQGASPDLPSEKKSDSAGFLNSTGTDAARADLHAAHRTGLDGPDLLQIRLKDLLGFIMRMADIAAGHRFFPTDITYVRHRFYLLMLSEQKFLA